MRVDELPPTEVEMLLSADSVGRQLDMAADTIKRWARQGKFLAPIYLGGEPRWRLADVNAWIMAQIEKRDD